MYTVVLMAALSAGTAAPDFHPHGGGHHGVVVAGCSGCYGCFGCYGGGYNGGGYAAPYGASCVGTYGGYSVSGPNPAYGCWGGWSSNLPLTVYSGPGTYGFGPRVMGGGSVGYGYNYGVSFQCHGCYGCYGGWSCYGSPTSASGYHLNDTYAPGTSVEPAPGAVPFGAPPAAAPPASPLPTKEQGKVRSKVIIEVPENAKLYVDDQLMKDGPPQRAFQTPPLNPGQTYFYEIRVEVTTNGKVTSDTQRVVIRPGETVTAAFNDPGRPSVVTVRNTPPE